MASNGGYNVFDVFGESSSDESFYGFSDSEINERRGGEDSDISVEEVSSGEEEIDEEGEEDFRGQQQEEVARPNVWTERLSEVIVPEFTANAGPTHELSAEKKEVDFFHQLFPEQIYQKIAEETNRYAIQSQEQKGALDRSWRPTDADEVKVYVGMRIYMSVVDLPDIKMYWSEDLYLHDKISSNK